MITLNMQALWDRRHSVHGFATNGERWYLTQSSQWWPTGGMKTFKVHSCCLTECVWSFKIITDITFHKGMLASGWFTFGSFIQVSSVLVDAVESQREDRPKCVDVFKKEWCLRGDIIKLCWQQTVLTRTLLAQVTWQVVPQQIQNT